MKLKLIAAVTAVPLTSFGATNVAFKNFSGITEGFPIVDNTGTPVPSEGLSIEVGTFATAFADNIGNLDTTLDDAQVIEAFTSSGTAVPANPTNIGGLFNTSISDADNGNSLLNQSIFVMVTDTRGAAPNVIVYSLGTTFPEQNGAGAGSVPSRQLELSDVVFGFTGLDGNGVAVNTTTLEEVNAGFGTGFERGVTFDAIPEPSTSLLASLAGLALLARRRR